METIILQQPLIILIILVAISLFALVVCSRYLIDGSVALARQFHISPLIIGTTIIGMGTSIDELMVNLSSLHLPNSSEIVMGNILGSNIVNLALGLGIPAMITTIRATIGIIEKEIPIYLALSALITSFAADGQLTQIEGVVFILAFIAIMLLIYQTSKRDAHHTHLLSLHTTPQRKNKTFTHLTQVFGGLALMLLGARVLVSAASGIAVSLGISSYVISIIIVGLGTSLPEIMASIQAALRKKSDIVLGNVLGSNIFNLCFGLGVPMLFNTFSINNHVMKDIYFLNILGVATIYLLLIDLRWFGKNKHINIIGGCVLIGSFILFITQKMLNAN